MRDLQIGAQRIGLTPEMIFRSADVRGLGYVATSNLAKYLQGLRLGLTGMQINKLISHFDMDSSGSVSKDEYYNSLETYCINSENHRRNN